MGKRKKSRKEITEDIVEHLDWIQSTVDSLDTSAVGVQKEVSQMMKKQIQLFEIADGKFVPAQDFRRRLIQVEDKIEGILREKTYAFAVKDYLSSFSTIADRSQALHRDINDLQVDMKIISPARKVVYEQAKEALYGSGIDYAFKEPVKHMLMQQVTTGGSISEMETLLNRWTSGDLSGSKSPTGKPIPNLQQYAGQLATDTSYQFNGTVQEIIRDEYKLNGHHYTGDIIEDSRPLCVYLIGLKRDVSNKELAEILNRKDLMPGRIPGTTVENFCTKRGGYRCRHIDFPVRINT